MVNLLDFFKNKNINNNFIQRLRDQQNSNDGDTEGSVSPSEEPRSADYDSPIRGPEVMYFDNDDDFAAFVFEPTRKLVVKKNSLGHEYSVAEPVLTSSYKNAEAAGTQFCVKDPKSHVNKDGMLGWEDVTLKINNVKRYK